MTIKPKILADWQKCCDKLWQASGAFDRNKDTIHREECLVAYRYRMRQCELAERRM